MKEACYRISNLVVVYLLNFIFLLHEMGMSFCRVPTKQDFSVCVRTGVSYRRWTTAAKKPAP